jgi:hypothetical protein
MERRDLTTRSLGLTQVSSKVFFHQRLISMIHQATLYPSSEPIQQCIQNCLDCHHACLSTVTVYCLPQLGQQHTDVDHLCLLLDCAEICQTSANFMLHGSDFHTRTCQICAEICDRCATDCERFAPNDQMQVCAETCRRCANSCRQMVMAVA